MVPPRLPSPQILIALSGRVSVGKTTLASGMVDRLGATIVKTRELLRAAEPNELGRLELQLLGRQMDEMTNGRWVADAVAAVLASNEPCVLVDAVRIPKQVAALRALGPLIHIHLTAPLATLAERHARTHPQDAYEVIAADATEAEVDRLEHLAQLVVDTSEHDISDVRRLAVSFTLAEAAMGST